MLKIILKISLYISVYFHRMFCYILIINEICTSNIFTSLKVNFSLYYRIKEVYVTYFLSNIETGVYNMLCYFQNNSSLNYAYSVYTLFFISNSFISNTRLRLAKNKQHPETKLLLFENYLLSSSTLPFKNNRRYSKNVRKTNTSV